MGGMKKMGKREALRRYFSRICRGVFLLDIVGAFADRESCTPYAKSGETISAIPSGRKERIRFDPQKLQGRH